MVHCEFLGTNLDRKIEADSSWSLIGEEIVKVRIFARLAIFVLSAHGRE